MSSKENNDFKSNSRPHIAHITNHGYGGVDIPIGGALDTGGQNFYVNSLAVTLDKLGYKVTIFARGGFHHFKSDIIRKEPEFLTPNVRYIYIQDSIPEFIRKEDIAVILDEEVIWLDNYIREEASQQGCKPWELFEFVNTHYWDAAVIGIYLVERWQNDIAFMWAKKLLTDKYREDLNRLERDRHHLSLNRSLPMELGKLILGTVTTIPSELIKAVDLKLKEFDAVSSIPDRFKNNINGITSMHRPLFAAQCVGEALLNMGNDKKLIDKSDMDRIDTHVWTMHSLGMLKEKNFRNKEPEEIRSLKFLERRHHEEFICRRTKRIASTSPEMTETLRTYYGVSFPLIFFFPPCIDRDLFRPYEGEPLERTYKWLSEVSGISIKELKDAKIVFETSRMDITKRKDVLLRGFSKVADKLDNCYLFIGGGPKKEIHT
jgi:glycosyltransferase involved in cell wall biosynthesis